MELLRKIENRGYPTEYLLSRIKGRRAYLITDWMAFLTALDPLEPLSSTYYKDLITDSKTEAIWRHLLREYNWVYFQMNRRLQGIFRPFFQFSELRTIFFSLRYKAGREDRKMKELLNFSLLSEEFKNILRDSENVASAIKGIEYFFTSLSDRFKGIKEISLKEGLKNVERRLTSIYLEYMIDSRPHPVIKDFFIRIVDLRNIITLYKYLWWEIKETPSFIIGGSISTERLMQVMDKRDIFEIGPIIKRLTGIKIEGPDTTNIENSLLKWIRRFMIRTGREPSGIGLLMDYLWRCYIEARNLGVILNGRDIDRETISAELIN